MGRRQGLLRRLIVIGVLVAGLILALGAPSVALAAKTSFSVRRPVAGSSTNDSTPRISVRVYDSEGVRGARGTAYSMSLDRRAVPVRIYRYKGYGYRKFKLFYDRSTPLAEGSHRVHVKIKDRKGNIVRTTWFFRVDTVAPVTTPDVSALPKFPGLFIIGLTATDAGSGVAATYWQLDGGPVVEGTMAWGNLANGAHTLKYWSVDKTGNIEATKTLTTVVGDPHATPASSCSVAGCHSQGLTVIHQGAELNGLPKPCPCHASGVTPTNDCRASACHVVDPHAAGGHPVIASVGSTPACTLAGCHGTSVVPIHPTCASCHASTDPAVIAVVNAPGAATCEDCHGTNYPHPGAGAAHANPASSCNAAGCHNDPAVDTMHAGTASSCTACHKVAPGYTLTKVCATCHPSIKAMPGHTGETHVSIPSTSTPGCTEVTCHGAAVATIHVTGGCAGCHGTPAVWAKVVAGNTKCETCHTEPFGTTHYDAARHTTTTQGASTAYRSIACASCHVTTTGTSMELLQTHTQPYVVMTAGGTEPPGVCSDCHDNPGSRDAIDASWNNGSGLCSDCHDGSGIALAHGSDAASHTASASTGCASTGAGCHNGSDLFEVGVTNAVNSNIHTDCLRCHDKTGGALWSAPGGGNLAYNPNVKTCGQATGCHTSGSYSTSTKVHRIGGGASEVNGADSKHTDTVMTGLVGGKACSACHSGQLALAHKETSTTANLNNSATGWDDTADVACLDCHNSPIGTPDISPAQVKTGWTNNDCGDCHADGTDSTKISGMHDRYDTSGATNHVGVPAGALAAQCGTSGGCHTTRELGSIPGHVASGGCSITGCHDSVDKDMMGTPKGCGEGVGNCHNSATYSAPHGSSWDHLTMASAYNGASTYAQVPAGCTGSGAGCHGSATNVGTIHTGTPYASCATGTSCHAGPKSSKQAGNHECEDCHGGVYADTPDRILMTDTYPSGHYNDTTHTVNATDMALRFDNASYTLGNRCLDCHDDSLRTVHTGTSTYNDVVCTECHNADAIAVAGWVTATSSCSDCHGLVEVTDYHNTYNTAHTATDGTNNCASSGAGCHASSDLRVLHRAINGGATTAGCGVAQCHTTLDARPSIKACGSTTAGCHTTYTDTTGHLTGVTGNEALYHLATSGMSATLVWGPITKVCSDCHASGLTTAHATSATANTCAGCHNDTTPNSVKVVKTNSWSTKTCDECHVTEVNGGTAKHNTYANHTGTSTRGCLTSGVGCHGTQSDLRTIHQARTGAATTFGCNISGCHAPDKDMASAPKNCENAACHSGYTTGGGGHIGITTGDDAAYHTATSGMTAKVGDATYDAGGGNTCQSCHSATLTASHATSANANTCAGCHNATAPNSVLVIKTNSWSTKTCDECHVTNVNGGTAMHNTYTAGTHTATYSTNTSTGCGSLGADCHSNTADVRILHNEANAGCTSDGNDRLGTNPAACHALNKDMSSTPMSCGRGGGTGSCHSTYNSGNHGGDHTANYSTTMNGIAYTYDANVGCTSNSNGTRMGCHYPDLRLEHGPTTLNVGGAFPNLYGAGRAGISAAERGTHPDRCTTCHAKSGYTSGTLVNNAVVMAAIAAGDARCTSCHKSGGATLPHSQSGDFTTGVRSPQFNDWTWTATWGNGNSAHNSYPGMGNNTITTTGNTLPRSSFTNGATTYAWPLALNLTGQNPRTGTTWANNDAVLCNDCHINTTAAGPQGASTPWDNLKDENGVAINGTTGEWRSPTVKNVWADTVCGNCHNEHFGNHANQDIGEGGACVDCHIRIPHGWKRPRLLGYYNDPETAYRSGNINTAGRYGGLAGIKMDSGEPISQSGNCADYDCAGGRDAPSSKHNESVSPSWP